MRIVLMGPPGAGKGTQAKRLAEQFGMKHLSSGDILRAEKAGGSELGKTLAKYMDAGQLVPDDVVVSVMAKALTSDGSAGLLLDGFPRTVPQAQSLDAQLAQAGKPLDAVVVMTADESLILNRITGRWSCPACGEVYHTVTMPPKQAGVCDKCGAALTQRADDTEAVVRKRLDAYNRQTEPVIGYYRSRGDIKMIEVDGGAPAAKVTADIASALKSIKA
ncbi:MAG: adenylate kinase [Planctomycetaceae bacterium]|nr:MAG: adenylate kinase [Planctomycetaceae bacterium]